MMKIPGKLTRSGHWWAVECAALNMHTQGKTRKEALEMAVDWVQTALDLPDFPVSAELDGKDGFYLTSPDIATLVALAVAQKRMLANVSYRDLAATLGLTSASSLADKVLRKHDVGVGRLSEIMAAMGVEMILDFKPAAAAPAAKLKLGNVG